MAIYIILYAFLLCSIFFEKKYISKRDKKLIILLLVLIFTVFRGLRWETGTDWTLYYDAFIAAKWTNISSYTHSVSIMDSGYMFLNVFVKSLGGNYTTFLLVTNFAILYSYYKFSITNSESPIYVFVLVMFSTQFFPVRMGLATAFIIYGLCNFIHKKHFRVIFLTILAATIHKSALIFLPVYLFTFFLKITTKQAFILALVALVISSLGKVEEILIPLSIYVDILGGENIANKYEHYFDYDLAQKSGAALVKGFSTILNSVIFIITLIPFGKIVNKEFVKGHTDYRLIYNLYFAFVIIGILFSSDSMLGLKRMQNYFMVSFPILFSLFIMSYKEKYYKIQPVFTIIFIFYVLFRSYTLFFSGYLEEYFPYYTILDNKFTR